MGETTCFMKPFSYASGGLPHHPIEGNPMHHALTQSISFGRFVSESPSSDRWSAFPGNRYVEEAEKFSRPGSVAQKKAFFEAHYRNMAARKKAAEEAAAMLEQANAAAISGCESLVPEDVSPGNELPANLARDNDKSVAVESSDECRNDPVTVSSESGVGREDRAADPVLQFPGVEAADTESCGSAEIEKPLMKDFIREEVSVPVAVYSKMFRNPKSSSLTPLPYWKENIAITPIARNSAINCSDAKRWTPRRRLPLGYLATPVKEINKATTFSWRMGNSKSSVGPKKDCRTPSKTPTVACRELSKCGLQPPANVTGKYALTTPKSVKERTPAGDGKQTGPKRRALAKECSKFLSACKNKLQSPSLSTPFRLRTEERAARRKEKLEEKFEAEKEKIQLQHILKEKEETDMKKFRQTLCFKARPLPKFYRGSTTTAVKSPEKGEPPNCCESSRRSRKPWSSSCTTLPNRVSPNLQGKKLVLSMAPRDLALEIRPPNSRRLLNCDVDNRTGMLST